MHAEQGCEEHETDAWQFEQSERGALIKKVVLISQSFSLSGGRL
jgi:hypothetical protein